MIYFKTNNGILYNGDVIDELKKLPDESVNMCVTSPPYWGLRDYGTAIWEGGSENCNHIDENTKAERERNRKGLAHNANNDGANRKGFIGNEFKEFQYKEICQKCGAVRIDKQLGLEKAPAEYVSKMVEIFREVKRVLRSDGILWLNLGDSYYSNIGGYSKTMTTGNATAIKLRGRDNKPKHKTLKEKDLCGIPWRVAFALQKDGWYLRQDIIWHKPNPMPESVTDRCTKSHEYIFLMSKSAKYYYNMEAIKVPAAYDGRKDTMMKGSEKYKNSVVPGKKEHTMAAQGHERWQWINGVAMKNKRSVWNIPIKPYKEAHFAVFPEKLIKPCILAGCPKDGIVIDPFFGSGTSGVVSEKNGRKWIGIDLNNSYCKLAKERITIISKPKDSINYFF